MGDFNLIKIESSIFSASWEFTIKVVQKIPALPGWIFAGSTLATVLASMKVFSFHSYLQAFKNYLEENWLDFFLAFDKIFVWGTQIVALLLILMIVDRLIRYNDEYII